jgi:hypothetical protein
MTTPEGDLEPQPQRLRTTGPKAVVACVLVGLVGGWAVRPLSAAMDATAPRVVWLQALALYLVAAILGWAARATRVAVERRQRLEPHQAVNRLVLGKACALVGALVAGGYLGYALSWVGVDAELSSERITISLVAACGAALTTGAALLLERACRVRDDDEEP